ncbi:DUF4097 and DUF4098 domain-containing protein YvlB [Aeromicrobium panaciterrae]|uniref:DUF4097 and DUF4098 domain-containing protein YvlB n=1 Tax=Aeromicrobium panaciterrae TaxID=363861 RepID=A0ABU1UJ90_9ACTN|nr:DUF4097 family beta strand repeat-containing protein [Aeromicrobium panaciterrae]MDR7085247.1 DUF4097 and DUF4098 domain-containing protein YvlB [Aeromicrobium panaciterrae]
MSTFPTPEPIDVTIDVAVGNATFIASDRTDTVVDVRPTNPANKSDVKAAEETRVEFANGKLEVHAPKGWKHYASFKGNSNSITVTIELPTGSTLHGDSAMGNFVAEGKLGNVRLKTAMGNIELDRTAALVARSSFGNITVEDADGPAEIHTSSGDLTIRKVAGKTQVKNSNGTTKLGQIGGDLHVRSSNGDITIDSADASVDAKTANGTIHAANVARGTVTLATAAGDLEVGIREGTAAWLDVSSSFGNVNNTMAATDGPPPSGDTVEVRGRTSFGDITIRRSAASA